MDPKRRRRYLQIGFGSGALVVSIIVLYLLRDFLGALVLGAAIAFLIGVIGTIRWKAERSTRSSLSRFT